MMKLQRSPHLLVLGVSFLLTTALTVLRCFAALRYFDSSVGYFTAGEPIVTAVFVLTAVYIVLALAGSLVTCIGRRIASEDPSYARFAALAVGAVLCFTVGRQVVLLWDNVYIGISGALLAFAVLFLFGGLLYFVLTFLAVPKAEPYRAIGALSMVFFGIFYALFHYFLKNAAVNSDSKITRILSAVALFMFFLMEAKRILYKKSGASNRFFSLCAFLFGCFSTIPDFVLYLSGKGSVCFTDLSHALLFAAVGLYAFVRLCADRHKSAAEAVTVPVEVAPSVTEATIDEATNTETAKTETPSSDKNGSAT